MEERLQDFHEFIADREVKAVINTVGGYNSNQLLEQLDYELIRKYPKLSWGIAILRRCYWPFIMKLDW